MKVYQKIATGLQARANCIKTGNSEWETLHEETLKAIADEALPSGSGFDSGTQIDIDASTPQRIVLHTSYHHMNEHGYYDGWTDHKVIITPSLVFDFDIRVTGRDRNEIKDYIADVLSYALSLEEPSAAAMHDKALKSAAYKAEYIAAGRIALD